MTTSLFSEQVQYQERLAELASMSAVDLTNLENQVEAKQKQLTFLQVDISATEELVTTKVEELANLQSDTSLKNIDSRVKAILTAEKTVELLRKRLEVLKNLKPPIETELSQVLAQIKELKQHLDTEARTKDLELFINNEFLPSQTAHADMMKKLFERLNDGTHYLKLGGEQLRKPGELKMLLNDSERKFKFELVRYRDD